MATRKSIIALTGNVMTLKKRHDQLSKQLAQQGLTKENTAIIAQYQTIIDKLTDNAAAMPIGHRYTGEFYLKKSYVNPIEFNRFTGTLFMRENLVTWTIEKVDGQTATGSHHGYTRYVYKAPDVNAPLITREEGEPVFDSLQ